MIDNNFEKSNPAIPAFGKLVRAIAFYIMLRKFRTFLPKNAFLLKSTKAFMKTLIDDLRKEAEKMRKKLKQLGSQKRHTFIGRFERVGYLYYGTGACFL